MMFAELVPNMPVVGVILAVVGGIVAYLGGLGWLLFRRGITGPKFLGFMVGVFGLIIAVNLVLAFKAVSTFPGLEVDNSYVASQAFDSDKAAQKALGWKLTHDYENGELRLSFADKDGLPAEIRSLDVLVGRTTESREDIHPQFTREAGVYVAKEALQPGKWMMHVEARAKDGTLFRQRLDMFVKG